MIRKAIESDAYWIMPMARRFHAASPWRDIEFDEESTARNLAAFISEDAYAIFVAHDQSGAIGILKAPIYFANAYVAQEIFWWCESPHNSLALLSAAEKWASDNGVQRMCMIRLHGLHDEQLDRFYRRRGYVPTEHTYTKVM